MDDLDPAGFKTFRSRYPEGANIVVAHDVDRGFSRSIDGLTVRFENLAGLKSML